LNTGPKSRNVGNKLTYSV